MGYLNNEPMQQISIGFIGEIDHALEVDLVVDFTVQADDTVFDDSEEEIGEFKEDSDSAASRYSSDSK